MGVGGLWVFLVMRTTSQTNIDQRRKSAAAEGDIRLPRDRNEQPPCPPHLRVCGHGPEDGVLHLHAVERHPSHIEPRTLHSGPRCENVSARVRVRRCVCVGVDACVCMYASSYGNAHKHAHMLTCSHTRTRPRTQHAHTLPAQARMHTRVHAHTHLIEGYPVHGVLGRADNHQRVKHHEVVKVEEERELSGIERSVDCVCVCACVRGYMRFRACVCVCVWVRADVGACVREARGCTHAHTVVVRGIAVTQSISLGARLQREALVPVRDKYMDTPTYAHTHNHTQTQKHTHTCANNHTRTHTSQYIVPSRPPYLFPTSLLLAALRSRA